MCLKFTNIPTIRPAYTQQARVTIESTLAGMIEMFVHELSQDVPNPVWVALVCLTLPSPYYLTYSPALAYMLACSQTLHPVILYSGFAGGVFEQGDVGCGQQIALRLSG